MPSLRKAICGIGLAVLVGALMVLAQPSPPRAEANPICDVAGGPAGVVTGVVGAGNPVGDLCNKATDGAIGTITSPIKSAVQDIGNGIFKQITSWVTEGASWLIGQVVSLINETTSPDLSAHGFLDQYAKMAGIAAYLAALMLLFAVIEGTARGDWGMLARVMLVNLPAAAIATSVAFVVVQLLLGATDGLSHAIAVASNKNSQHFFAGAIHGLSQAGGESGAVAGTATGGPGVGTAVGGGTGAAAAPLFVTFLLAVIGAFAAFFVWLELLMRDAGIYVVALFMPMALGAAIWPRWSGALRRTAEVLVVLIGSKFVIVSVISLAAGLLAHNNGEVEQILAASALMLVACFAPFVLFKLVPFTEGAVAAAYGRRSAAAGASHAARQVSPAQMMRSGARGNWGGAGAGELATASAAGGDGAGVGGMRGALAGGANGSQGLVAGPGASSAGAAAAGPAAAATMPVAAALASEGAAERLAGSGTAEAVGSEAGHASGGASASDAASGPQRPPWETAQPGGTSEGDTGAGDSPTARAQPPRPAPDIPAGEGEREA